MNEPNLHTMSFLRRLAYRAGHFFASVPGAVVRAGKAVGKGIASLGKAVADGCGNFVRIFIRGDIFTKLSYLIMGVGCAVRGQVVKGLLFFGSQVGLIYFIVSFGWNYLRDIGTLGTVTESQTVDPKTGLILYQTADNSMLILLYSVMTLMIIALFLALYYGSIQACYRAQLCHERGVKPTGFTGEIKSLLNDRYHVSLLTLPTALAVALIILPLIFMILIAFTNYDMKHQPPGNLFTWVGLENFRSILGSSPLKTHTFQYLLRWTIIWAVVATVSNYILGMLLAMLINKKGIRFKRFWRTIFVLTIAVPQFVSLLVMRNIFADQGTINVLLKAINLHTVPFLSNGTIARYMIILINIWVGIPYSMLITSGILMNIPAELYESARIDGAGPVKTFTKITLPYMLFVTTPYLITQFIGNFNNFNVIYLLTLGDPKSLTLYQAGETDLLVTWLYKLTVNFQDYNLASVIGIMVFIVSATLSLVVYNSSSSVKREEDFQ